MATERLNFGLWLQGEANPLTGVRRITASSEWQINSGSPPRP